jgi:hypothetical protein
VDKNYFDAIADLLPKPSGQSPEAQIDPVKLNHALLKQGSIVERQPVEVPQNLTLEDFNNQLMRESLLTRPKPLKPLTDKELAAIEIHKTGDKDNGR